MTYSRNKTNFIYAFNKAITAKFKAASLGLDKWRSLSDLAGTIAANENLDREFFYKSGSLILRPLIKDIVGHNVEDYELKPYQILVLYVGDFVQFEVRKNHNDKYEYRIVKAA